MVISYKCDKCKKIFDRKSNYNAHINRKTVCIRDELGAEINTKAIPADCSEYDSTKERSTTGSLAYKKCDTCTQLLVCP